MAQDDTPNTSENTQLTQAQSNFVKDWSNNKYAKSFLISIYTEDKVKEFMRSDAVILALHNIREAESLKSELRTKNWTYFGETAMDVIAKSLKGEDVKDHQIATAKWILGGERAYAEARAKVMGERSAQSNEDKTNRPSLRVVVESDEQAL